MRGITDPVDIRSKDHNDVGRVTTNTPGWGVANSIILWATGGNLAPGQRFIALRLAGQSAWFLGLPTQYGPATFPKDLVIINLCVTLRSTRAGRAQIQ